MDHQDWDTVIIKKKVNVSGRVTAEEIRKGAFETVKKTNTGPNMAKIERDTEDAAPKTVSTKLAQAIISARTAKKMTRDQLAVKINEKPKVIELYETKKAVPDPAVLSKMSRALGVSLRRDM
ncbi:multiprotein-bridging factor [Acanthocystis turfacea Chlorella virus MO0605SPH]|nr:multiprotein-bridging factor [Acanthocystis turfacea Chlorella virus MO0605SPH]